MPYLEANGIRMRYEAWGGGSSALVMLHGLGSCADDWLLQLPAFAPYFRCIPVDLRGHGLSDRPPGPYSVALLAADVAALLRGLGIESAHILGLSLGGLVAQQMGIDYPALVRSLVLINTFPGLWPPAPGLLRANWRRLPGLWRHTAMAETAARVAQGLFPRPEQALLRAQAEARLATNDPRAYRCALRAALRFRPATASLRRLSCPALVIAGDEDRIVPHAYKERLCRLLPDARLVVIPGSGHASNIDAAEAVNEAALEFLLAREQPAVPAAWRTQRVMQDGDSMRQS